ncbi:MAG: hypothetical protein AB7H86_08365 [Blastocatellales bacterium]|nr:hypothetical protein [Nitrosomonas nitrosa]
MSLLTYEQVRPWTKAMMAQGSVPLTANCASSTDQGRPGLTFARKPPKERVLTRTPANSNFAIANYRVDYDVTVMKPVRLLSMLPQCICAVYPNGERQTLLRVTRYNLNWPLNYCLAER